MSRSTIARSAVSVVAAATLSLAGAAAAQAHVRVIPESTAGGSFTKLTFRVPNESDTASTTSLAVSLPLDTPFAHVSAQQLDGWTVTVTKAKLAAPVEAGGTTLTEAASKVTWTASKGNEIGPGQFQEFSLSGGPLPTTAKALAFPAVQTYSDGKVVAWDQPEVAGGAEAERPVPSFELTAASAEGAHGAAEAAPSSTGTGSSSSSTDGGSDGAARALGAAGVVAGLIGLAFGMLAWRRSAVQPGAQA